VSHRCHRQREALIALQTHRERLAASAAADTQSYTHTHTMESIGNEVLRVAAATGGNSSLFAQFNASNTTAYGNSRCV